MKWSSVFIILTAILFLMFPVPVSADTADDVKCIECVSSPDIMDGGVKNPDIAAGVVTTSKIKDGAVDKHKIKNGSVGWDHLVSSLRNRIKELEATVAALEETLATNTVLKLDGYLDLDTSDPAKPTARFAGVNVQVVNGLGQTASVNGLGNVIIGYDEAYPWDYAICSDGNYASQTDCESAGEVWSSTHKSGSHNLVVGYFHRYSQAGGLIAGSGNGVNSMFASVTGGEDNVASGDYASISGGVKNIAGGSYSAVSGGDSNVARGSRSAVSGGDSNVASGLRSAVSGGYDNAASEEYSVVSGGSGREASGYMDWAAGSLWQDW